MEGKEPKVAFIAILNKKVSHAKNLKNSSHILTYLKSQPIILRNFMAEALKQAGATDLEEIDMLDLQMKMLVY